MKLTLKNIFATVCFFLVMIAISYQYIYAEVEMDSSEIIAWNDSVQSIWASDWGGGRVKNLLDPNISELQRISGNGVDVIYLKDTVKWLEHILKKKYIPSDLWEHCVAVNSHILLATDTGRFSHMRERIDQKQIAVETYKKEANIDTSGILVRYEIEKYAFLVVDKAMELCIIIKVKDIEQALEKLGDRTKLFWDLMEDAFVEEMWKPDGVRASLHIWDEVSESGVYDAYMISSSASANKIQLNNFFQMVRVNFPPGPVVRMVFQKKLQQKEVTSVKYIPKTRFEEGTLFDNQNFGVKY